MLKPGDTFDRYAVEAILGRGGMGCVYLAHDTRLDRRVAVKIVLTEEVEGEDSRAHGEATARLMREARASAAIDHPNAVSIYDVGEVQGTPYIAMEFVPGKTLREMIDAGSAPLAERIGWLVDAARALSAAHKKGLVHRDVKPENVMVRDDGVVKVLDFGIAKRTRAPLDPSAPTEAPALATLTVEGAKLGTPLYMSPEQIRGEHLDGRADQFAWGVVAYELVTGKLPWRVKNDALALAASILTEEPDVAALRAAGASQEVTSVIRKTLSKKPADRYDSIDDVIRALTSAESDARGPSEPPKEAKAKPGATALQRFSPAEIREVLQRALEREGGGTSDDGRIGFDDLMEAAREVGVDPETLRAASRDLRAGASDAEKRAAFRRKQWRAFYQHAGIWAVVSVFLVFVDILSGFEGWWYWPTLGWGLGVAIHFISVIFADEDEWKKDERKKRAKREQSAAVDRAIDEGVSLLLRVTGVGSKAPEKVRVAAAGAPRLTGGTAREAAAEEEAAAAERSRERARKR